MASRTPDALEVQIRAIARQFAQGVLEAVCAADFAELTGAAPSPPAERRLAAAARRRSRGREAAGDVTALVVALRAVGDAGMVAEQLRAQLGLPRPAFLKAIGLALKTTVVRRTGAKRGTRYFAT